MSEAAAAAPARKKSLVPSRPLSAILLYLFLIGWITEEFSLINIGRYSIPLLYLAALPFCSRLSSRFFPFLVLPAISTLFAFVVGSMEGVDLNHILSQTALQVLALLFAAGVYAIDWRAYKEKLARALVVLGVPVVIYGGYQMVARPAHLPFAFLPVTNQQEYALEGLQRGWEKAEFTRASSLFVEPASFGYFCLWLVLVGISLDGGRLQKAALALGLAGIVFSQSLSAVIGLAILVIVYSFTHPVNFQLVRRVIVAAIISTVLLFILLPLFPDALTHFAERIHDAVNLDERADSGRVDHLPACWEIFTRAPVWGHGISSQSAAGADGLDVTSVSYALLLMERGALGTALFFAPWIFVALRACMLPRADPGRTVAILLAALNLYAFATSSMAYFLPYWFSLGMIASIVSNAWAAPRRAALNHLNLDRWAPLLQRQA